MSLKLLLEVNVELNLDLGPHLNLEICLKLTRHFCKDWKIRQPADAGI